MTGSSASSSSNSSDSGFSLMRDGSLQELDGANLNQPRRDCNVIGAVCEMRPFFGHYPGGHAQWINWLISKIGSSIANTMPMTNSPMQTMSTGPSKPTSAASSPSSSRSWLMAARSSMLSS